MPPLRFRSADGRYGLLLSPPALGCIADVCDAAGGLETGGVLVGHYAPAHDLAVVTDASGPPPDSRHARTRFHRGTAGLQGWLHALWHRPRRAFYVGEWHLHPGAPPVPSVTDDAQMAAIARSDRYRCPEPLLLIVGELPGGVRTVAACVYPGGRRIVLEQQAPTPGGK